PTSPSAASTRSSSASDERSMTMRRSRGSSRRCGAPGTSSPMSRIVWFRSLYSRIAFGFVVLLAALLLTQALLFLWLSWRIGDLQQGRTPQQLADVVARELSDALTADPTVDLGRHMEEHVADIRRPFAVLMRDGRRISNRPEAFAGG